MIGQTVSFLLARHALQARMQRWVSARWQHFDLIDAAMQREGATLIFVLRLNPCVPYNVLNYALGLTSISFFDYTWSSAIAIIPFVASFVYMGCLSTNVMELAEGGWAANGAMLPWALVSAVLVCGTVGYGYWFTRKALADAIEGAMPQQNGVAAACEMQPIMPGKAPAVPAEG